MTGPKITGEIGVTREGPVQVLRLVRPEKKNALTGPMYRVLSDALEAGDASDEIAAHVFCGSGGVFCAGNDIGDFLATAKGSGGLGEDVLRFIRLLPRVQKPLIAAVDGKAVGIGTTMLFHCDLVYATQAASFSTPFLELGLIPEAASSLLMPRVMGPQRAFEMLVLGETFSAERARDAGFVNAIVPDVELEPTALAAAQRLAAKPPEALAIARRLMRGAVSDIVARTNEEADAFKQRLTSPEALEAFQAFFEKRPPRFAKLRAKS